MTTDLRFSTIGNLSRPVVEEWVRTKDMATLETWLTQGPPHKRLADVAFGAAVSQKWLVGAQRLWASGWAPKISLLTTGWHILANHSWYRGEPAGAVENWLENLTWGETTDKDLLKAQRMGQMEALKRACKISPERWDRFLAKGVNLNVGAGKELLHDLLRKRFAMSESNPEKWATAEQSAVLDHSIDGLLSVPPTHRAPLTADTLVRLLWRAQEIQDQPNQEARYHEGIDGAWATLVRLLDQKKPGLTPKELALMASKMGIVARKIHLSQERRDHVLDALIRWGLPESVTFTEQDWSYGGNFYSLFRDKSGYVAPSLPSRFNTDDWAGRHTDRLDEKNPTLHVGDHWFHDDPTRDRWSQPMGKAAQARCRNQLAQRIEVPKLLKVMQVKPKKSALLPQPQNRSRL